MSKQNSDIFSPPLLPFSINLVEDNIDDNELKRISLKFNEMLACVDSDTDVSIT
ncbi:11571_t:CDS:1, partial [Funneliformis caledonium]